MRRKLHGCGLDSILLPFFLFIVRTSALFDDGHCSDKYADTVNWSIESDVEMIIFYLGKGLGWR